MTLDKIERRVRKIKNKIHDDEMAHSMEDDLREDFIKYIASHENEYQEMAIAVLRTNKLKFARWCA